MTEHYVFISTRKAANQQGVAVADKIRFGSAYCRCGWDTPIGIEQTMKSRGGKTDVGIFERAIGHLIEHDVPTRGHIEYNGKENPNPRTSLKWIGNDRAYAWGLLTDNKDEA